MSSQVTVVRNRNNLQISFYDRIFLDWLLFLTSAGVAVLGIWLCIAHFHWASVCVLIFGFYSVYRLLLTTIFNHMVIRITHDKLTFGLEPLPFPGWHASTLRTADIQQLYVGKRPKSSFTDRKIFFLTILLKSGYEYEMLTDIADLTTLLEIERRIEGELDLTDEPHRSLLKNGMTVTELEAYVSSREQLLLNLEANTWNQKMRKERVGSQLGEASRALETYRNRLG